MDSSRRAVESYWRSKMIDGVTADEDKVAPVYKLEEICELLRSSDAGIVKEISGFILKRLDHKSPIVKQKALRLIKYSVGKSGVDFKRQMQRHSAAIRQLFHYKGHPDPLKGDALNKAVRDTAHEAISAVFSSEDNKVALSEDVSRRIQGFGNTNFEMETDDKKSFLSEVVSLGSASIKQGLGTFSSGHSLLKSDNGSYKSPNLQRSLTTETNSPDRYETEEQSRGDTFDASRRVGTRTWNHDSEAISSEMMNGNADSSHNTQAKSKEERLLESIVASGGVRLQPTREALQIFLTEASKLDAIALSHALELKLRSHLWQVRMKAVCVLESILRRKDDANFSIVASYFSENMDVLIKCSESAQSSVREKTNKVLSLLESEMVAGEKSIAVNSLAAEDEKNILQMPDLIDTGNEDDIGSSNPSQKHLNTSIPGQTSQSFVDDLLGEDHDPFADVSFHSEPDKGHSGDPFPGLAVDDSQANVDLTVPTSKFGPELLDVFGVNPTCLSKEENDSRRDVNDLMGNLSINVTAPEQKQPENFRGSLFETSLSDLSNPSINPSQNEVLSTLLLPQTGVKPSHPTSLFPLGPIPYTIPPNFMCNQGLSSQPNDCSAMTSLLAQQQLLAAMNFRNFGSLGAKGNSAFGHAAGFSIGENSSPLPDIFHRTNDPISSVGTATAASTTKKEETKAFDFISDHLSAARGHKRVV